MLASPALSGIDALIMGAGAAAHAAIAQAASSPRKPEEPVQQQQLEGAERLAGEEGESSPALTDTRPGTGKKRSECPLALYCALPS